MKVCFVYVFIGKLKLKIKELFLIIVFDNKIDFNKNNRLLIE